MTKSKINLYVLKKNKRGIRQLRQMVFDYLGDTLYEIVNEKDLIYQAIKGIYPVNKNVINEITFLEVACIKLAEMLPIRKGKLVLFNDDGEETEIMSKAEELSPFKNFLQTYLQLETAPGIAYRQIQQQVQSDLRQLGQLIKYYETKKYIQSWLASNSRPRGHEEVILFDFYHRCIKEQKIVIDYYLNGLKDRAIAKANYWFPNMRATMKWAERFRDRPYQFAQFFSYPYFDSRAINLIANKIFDFPYNMDEELQKLYAANKTAFYRKIFERNKPVAIIQELDFYLSHLPLANNRRPIFNELHMLFRTKRWIGYYSLALAQIEGLFSEMYTILNPNQEFNRKALPEKVEFVRPYYEMSSTYLDYYQYHIPRQRNKFMHSGFDEDFKLKSYDLLLDLRYLLKIFYELNNPLVKIKQLHTRRNHEDFINYADFARYFELVNKLDVKQRKNIEADITDFEMSFLVDYCDAGYICQEVVEQLPKELADFSDSLFRKLDAKGKKIDLSNKNWGSMKSSISGDVETIEILKEYYYFNSYELESLNAYSIFLNNFKKQLPSLNKEYIKSIDEIVKKDGIALKNLMCIKDILPIMELK